jgi:hypothetical protein
MSRRWCAGLVALAIVLAACTGKTESGSDGAPLSWTRVDLPAGDEPVLLTPSGTELLIGLRHPGTRVVPRLMTRAADGRSSVVPLQPKSPYAFEAKWHSVTTDGSRILAIGGAPGGAHSNTRWTVWSGSASGLVEQPQSFNTFGGWGAGSVVDAVITPAGQALVGTWGSEQAGLDAAVWLPHGERWIRQSSAGTALESTRELQVGPRSAATAGAGIVLAGSQLSLVSGVRQQAALWRSTTLNQGWARLELPDPGDRSEAVSAHCTPEACTVAGYVDGQLAMWKVEGSAADRLDGLPPVTVGDRDVVPAPIDLDGRLVQVVGDGGRVRVVSGDGTNWTVHDGTGPTGAVTDAALAGNQLYVLAGATLWRTDVAAVR